MERAADSLQHVFSFCDEVVDSKKGSSDRACYTAIRLRIFRRFFNTAIPEAGRAEAGIWKK